MKEFDSAILVEKARKNLPHILDQELECGAPLNHTDENSQYVFRYKDGTALPVSWTFPFKKTGKNTSVLWDIHWTDI